MSRNNLFALFLLLLVLLGVALATHTITRQAMIIEQLQEAPSSAALAAVAELREMNTPPPQKGSGWPLAVALGVLLLLAVTGALFAGERFTKQFRLLKRKRQPRPRPQHLVAPQTVPELTAGPGRTRNVPSLPPPDEGYL